MAQSDGQGEEEVPEPAVKKSRRTPVLRLLGGASESDTPVGGSPKRKRGARLAKDRARTQIEATKRKETKAGAEDSSDEDIVEVKKPRQGPAAGVAERQDEDVAEVTAVSTETTAGEDLNARAGLVPGCTPIPPGSH